MNTIRKLLSAWMLAFAGGLLLPMISVAAVSDTTYAIVGSVRLWGQIL